MATSVGEAKMASPDDGGRKIVYVPHLVPTRGEIRNGRLASAVLAVAFFLTAGTALVSWDLQASFGWAGLAVGLASLFLVYWHGTTERIQILKAFTGPISE